MCHSSRYNDTYEYPQWATVVGLTMALSSMLLVPFYALYALVSTPGSLRERWRTLATSTGSPAMEIDDRFAKVATLPTGQYP